MALELDPQLVTLVGSGNRASVLAALASATTPQTGYRIARLANVQPIKAYTELRRLRSVGIVRELRASDGRSVWELPDGAIRSFVASRARIAQFEEWIVSQRRGVGPSDRRFARALNDAAAKRPRARSNPPAARAILVEMTRPPEKDKVLELLRLPSSVRRGRR